MSKTTVQGLHRLTTIGVREAVKDADDGGGLLLRVATDGRASWVLRFTSPSGKRREMGLGVCHRASQAQAGESVAQARKLANAARLQLDQGIDPLDDRDQRREAAKAAISEGKQAAVLQRDVEHWTLARCARDYHERVVEPKLSSKHAAQWIASLENHVPASLWHAPIATVTAPQVVAALLAMKPHKRARHLGTGDRLGETRGRVLQRLATVFDDAVFHGRATTNPAGTATRRKVTEAAPKRRKGAHAALPYAEAPSVMQTIANAEGTAAKALLFAVLTACRTSEALGATWAEVDLRAKVWNIPASRTKTRRVHDVPLSPQALRVLADMRGFDDELVFPSSSPSADGKARPLSNMAMLVALKRMGLGARTTVHGLARATFSTWANERGIARPDVIEAALAHTQGDKVRAAYNRASHDEQRRALLEAWGEYLQREAATVIALRVA